MVKATPSWKGAPQWEDKDAGFSFKPRGALQLDAGYVGFPDGKNLNGTVGGLAYNNLGFNTRARRIVFGADDQLFDLTSFTRHLGRDTGAKLGGASRRGMVGAFAGGIAGAAFGNFMNFETAEAELVEDHLGRRNLALPAVDHDQVRDGRERLVVLGGRRAVREPELDVDGQGDRHAVRRPTEQRLARGADDPRRGGGCDDC